jgi:hypothetical protein
MTTDGSGNSSEGMRADEKCSPSALLVEEEEKKKKMANVASKDDSNVSGDDEGGAYFCRVRLPNNALKFNVGGPHEEGKKKIMLMRWQSGWRRRKMKPRVLKRPATTRLRARQGPSVTPQRVVI